jgi:Holliday junction resolvasome RuvABC ATP-dependent DNA helicase subunit
VKEKMKKDLFSDIVGQARAKLAIKDWYLHEDQPLLIYGSSGFGKTMFAESLGARTIDTTQMRGDRLNSILKPIKESEDGEILFFDEIHSMQGKVLEGLYKIIDKGTFYDTDLCMDLPIPKVRFVFATNIINPLPEAFINRCRFVELEDYNLEELKQIINKRYPSINKNALESIVKSAKGVPRTALSYAKSIIAGAKTDKVLEINKSEVNRILDTRMGVNPETGLNEKEFKIVQKVIERGRLSTTAVANVLKTTLKDAQQHYIEPLRAAEWLAVSQQGVIPGYRAHENYRLFTKRGDK